MKEVNKRMLNKLPDVLAQKKLENRKNEIKLLSEKQKEFSNVML